MFHSEKKEWVCPSDRSNRMEKWHLENLSNCGWRAAVWSHWITTYTPRKICESDGRGMIDGGQPCTSADISCAVTDKKSGTRITGPTCCVHTAHLQLYHAVAEVCWFHCILKLASQFSMCLLKIHMECVGRVRENERKRQRCCGVERRENVSWFNLT